MNWSRWLEINKFNGGLTLVFEGTKSGVGGLWYLVVLAELQGEIGLPSSDQESRFEPRGGS